MSNCKAGDLAVVVRTGRIAPDVEVPDELLGHMVAVAEVYTDDGVVACRLETEVSFIAQRHAKSFTPDGSYLDIVPGDELLVGELPDACLQPIRGTGLAVDTTTREPVAA